MNKEKKANASVIHLTGILMPTVPQSKHANCKVYGYILKKFLTSLKYFVDIPSAAFKCLGK